MAHYFTIMQGLRGCYMPDNAYTIQCETRRDLKAAIAGMCRILMKAPAGEAVHEVLDLLALELAALEDLLGLHLLVDGAPELPPRGRLVLVGEVGEVGAPCLWLLFRFLKERVKGSVHSLVCVEVYLRSPDLTFYFHIGSSWFDLL